MAFTTHNNISISLLLIIAANRALLLVFPRLQQLTVSKLSGLHFPDWEELMQVGLSVQGITTPSALSGHFLS